MKPFLPIAEVDANVCLCREHDALDDAVGQRLAFAWEHGVVDPLIARMIKTRAEKVRRSIEFGTALPFRKARTEGGDFNVGKNLDGTRICRPLEMLAAGGCLAGNSGSGKTNALKFYLLQIVCFVFAWAFELYKKELRHLVPLMSALGRAVSVVQAADIKLNPLQADTVDPRTHLNFTTDLLGRELGLGERAASILFQTCSSLYRKFGIFDGQKDHWPTLFDAWEDVYAERGLNAAARDSLLNRLGSFLMQISPDCAAYRFGWTATALAEHSIFFELGKASELVKQVVVDTLLFSLFAARVESGIPNSPLRLVVAVEDGQRFFSSRPNATGIPVMDELLSVTRGCGIAVLALVQTLIGVSRRLMANLSFKAMGRLGVAQDYELMGNDLSMSAEQVAWAKRTVGMGKFVGQFAEGHWREPFPFTVPKIDAPPVFTDDDAKRSLSTLAAIRTVPAPEFARWQPFHSVELSSEPAAVAPELSKGELAFLAAVVASPGLPSSEYSKIAGISGKRCIEIRKRLIDLGYIREHELATGGRGRTSIILEPLERAAEVKGEAK